MLRKVLFLSLTVVWALGVVFAYFIGQNVGARKTHEQIQKAKRRQARQRHGRGGMGPGDRDPRGN